VAATKTKAKEEKVPAFDPGTLSEYDRQCYEHALVRIPELRAARRELYPEIERVWEDADRDYVPHRLNNRSGRRVVATDEERGWRGTLTTLDSSRNWRSDAAFPNPYVKIQAALAVLVDQNPVGVFFPTAKKYQAATELIKQLYQRSWDVARSKQQLKLFIFNLAKYGWAVGRTFPLRIERKVRVLTEVNPEDPDKNVYEEKTVVEFNDVMRENLDPFNVWIDDMARPGNDRSRRDWAWRRVYTYEQAQAEFGAYPRFKFVPRSGGVTTARLDVKQGKRFKSKDLVEVYFYENLEKDSFQVHVAGVPVVIEPLPISDGAGVKKLSLWDAIWNIRDAECPYGIGLYEAIRHYSRLFDSVSNMTVNQLKLAIEKMFFYQGTQNLTETGDMEIVAGKGKQVLDPKSITWMEVPGPGSESWEGMDKIQEFIDTISGITPTLLGEVTGKTAFELAQAKESALKRLKTPLDNITDALGTEAYITVSLMQILYSIPEVVAVTDPGLVEDYLREVDADPDLYERDEETQEFRAKIYREFPLNIEDDEEGNLIETRETQFFRVKPKFLNWEGIVNIKPQSVLSPSKQIDKALELEMYNILIPLLQPLPDPMTGQDQKPRLYGRAAREIVRLYDKDPRDVLPPEWLSEDAAEEPQQLPTADPNALFVPAGGAPGGEETPAPQAPASQPQPQQQVELPREPRGIVGRLASRIGGALRP
jgi:hypothetical protein